MPLFSSRRRARRPVLPPTTSSKQRRDRARRRSSCAAPAALEPLEPRLLFAGDFAVYERIGIAEPLPLGETFHSTGAPVISAAGSVLVTGDIEGPNVTEDNDLALLYKDAFDTSFVFIREGDPIPGIDAVFTDANIPQQPAFIEDDQSFPILGFSRSYTETGGGSAGGVWIGDFDSIERVTDRVSGTLGAEWRGISAAGHAIYRFDSFTDDELFINGDSVLKQGNSISLHGDTYTIALQTAGNITFSFGNAADQTLVRTRVVPAAEPQATPIDAILLVGPAGVVDGVLLPDVAAVVPGVLSISAADLNNAGQFLISVGTGAGTTMALVDGQAVTPIESPPLAGSSFQWNLGGGGQVVAGFNNSILTGVALWDDGQWQVIAEPGEPAPGMLDGSNFHTFYGRAINSSGVVVFAAGTDTFRGIWAYVNGELHLVVSEEGTQPIENGDPVDFDGIGFFQTNSNGESGQPSVLNNSGQLVFSGSPHNTTQDAIYVAELTPVVITQRIHGSVWTDANSDGVFDGSESGAQNVTVKLESIGGQVLQSTMTGLTGEYSFDTIDAGNYRVRIALPDGHVFSPTTGDAEIGGNGLSDVIMLDAGEDFEADAGLINASGPVLTLLGAGLARKTVLDSTDFSFTGYTVLFVSITDPDGIDMDSIELADPDALPSSGTGVTIFRSTDEGLFPAGVAYLTDISGDDVSKEGEFYWHLPIDFSQSLGDYIALTTIPTIKDNLGAESEIGAMVGSFSIVDSIPPEITDVSVTPTMISTVKPLSMRDKVTVTFTLKDLTDIDGASVVDGALAVRRVGSQETVPMTLAGTGPFDRMATYEFHAPQGTFSAVDDGEYEIITSTPAIKDTSGNAIDAGQVVGTFQIDFTPPEVKLTSTYSPVEGQSDYTFVIGWTDEGSGLDDISLESAQFRVRDPWGNLLNEEITRVSAIAYTVSAPGDQWDEIDRGVYTVELANDEAQDDFGNKTPVGTVVGTFSFLVSPTTEVSLASKGEVTIKSLRSDLKQDAFKFLLTTPEGNAILKAVGPDLIANELKPGKIDLSGLVESLESLRVESSSPKSSAKLTGKGKVEPIDLASLEVVGPFNSIDLRTVNVTGNIDASQGTAKKLLVGDVLDDHLIEIGPPEPGIDAIDIVLDRVANTDIVSLTPIKTLTVTEWIDDDGDPDTITAPWIGKIIVKGNKKENIAGDFEADLVLSGEGAPKGVALGSATIAGSLREADWNITGASGAIVVKGDVSDVNLAADAVKSLKLSDVSNVNVNTAGGVGAIQAVRWLDGQVTAGSVASVNITGDRKRAIPGDSSVSMAVFGPDLGKALLGNVKIAGDIVGGGWSVFGDAKTVAVGGAVPSGFAASFEGALASFAAKGDFAGTLVAFDVGKFSALSITGSRIGVGVSAGPDGIIGNQDDPFRNAGTLGSLKITTTIDNSIITVGLRAVNGSSFDGDDQFEGGVIKSLTVGGDALNSIFAAGMFPKRVSINKSKVDPTQDDRFLLLELTP